MQENGTAPGVPPESGNPFSEIDLALIDALQADPRAPWTRIGPALGVDATTAARRWDRLSTAGLAWVTAYAAPGTAPVAYLEVTCDAGSVAQLIAALAELPWVFSIEHVAGEFDLFLSVCATDLPGLGRLVQDIGARPEVRAVRTRLSLRTYLEGSAWQIRALAPARRAELTQRTPPDGPAAGPELLHSPTDLALLRALGEDGRAGHTELAARTGIGESTVRRHLNRRLRQRGLLLRCDLAQRLAGWPVVVGYRAAVPHGALDRVGAMLARLPQTRLCASVTGSTNLLFSVWLRTTDDITAVEAVLADRAPELRLDGRTVTFRTHKRMGRLLDPQGRALRHIPLLTPDT
ncbi:AsnC family transcriptional regulator [Kitasatospora xanthocidica]|uniref:Lrp/AsnC family transcriptional regulator n=1 Tax=Kitasatospora xanthocidica TaxID=83382 RepID=UPI001676A4FD|nr:Lrp/AsnC family transcriptional regulator [Kitasatospora xanthocidica]GHF76642.1 AsnC family transcriptional regulator [Kitasatospora xanthocidica]